MADTLTELATSVFVWAGVLVVLRFVLYAVSSCALGGGVEVLKIKLEVVLCRAREKRDAITVEPFEVYLAYGTAALYPVVAIVAWSGFGNQTNAMGQVSSSGPTLFDQVGQGDVLALVALAIWLGTLALALQLTYETGKVVFRLFIDPEFAALVSEHLGITCCNLDSVRRRVSEGEGARPAERPLVALEA